MDSVVNGITIDRIEIKLGGNEEDVVFLAVAKLGKHALDEAMLDALPAPAGILFFVIGCEGFLAGIRRGGKADGELGVRGCLAKFGEKFFSVGKNFGDLGVGVFGIGTETIVDAEEKGDDIRRLVIAVFLEVAGEVEGTGDAIGRGKNERAGFLAGERASSHSFLWSELGEETNPSPATVTFMGNAGLGRGWPVGAEKCELRIVRCGAESGDFVWIDGGVSEAVANDE